VRMRSERPQNSACRVVSSPIAQIVLLHRSTYESKFAKYQWRRARAKSLDAAGRGKSQIIFGKTNPKFLDKSITTARRHTLAAGPEQRFPRNSLVASRSYARSPPRRPQIVKQFSKL